MFHLVEVSPRSGTEGGQGSVINSGKIVPPKRSNPKAMHRAGELRREPTPAERKLWAYLRGDKLNGVNFRRQHAIGNFIPDFPQKGKMCIDQKETYYRTRWPSTARTSPLRVRL
ncbi:MAG: DUF559 domain-containing protein [Anaerolineales bacterium]|nr:DUF559 domain-containing protein [Anaerolineales bacterium]